MADKSPDGFIKFDAAVKRPDGFIPFDEAYTPMPTERAAPAARGTDPSAPRKGTGITNIDNSAIRGAGQMVSAYGSDIRDIPGGDNLGKDIEGLGKWIVGDNTSEINTVGDALKHPLTTAGEAVGELIPQVAVGAGTARLGAMAGSRVGGVPGAVVGGTAGFLAPVYAQEYGGIRADQRDAGIDDKLGAAAFAGIATGLEAVGPVGKYAKKLGMGILGKVAGKSVEEVGGNLLSRVLHGAVKEGATEIAQSVAERQGAHKELTGAEALNEYGVSGIKGAIGGAGIGAIDSGPRKSTFEPEQQTGEAEAPAAAPPPAPVIPTAPRGQQPGLFDLDDVLDNGIAPTETGGNPAQVSSQNARGKYQLLPSTAKQMAAEIGVPYDEDKLLNDPAYNRSLAKQYMSNLLTRYDGDMFSAVTAYHAGEGNTDRWIAKYGAPAEIGHQAFLDKVRAAGNPRSADYAAKVFGAMGRDMGEQAPAAQQDTGLDELAALAEPTTIIQRLRGTRVDADGKSLPADSTVIRTANKLSTALKDGDVDSANAALDAEAKSIDKKIETLAAEQTELETARAGGAYTDEEFAERNAKFETQLDKLVQRSEVVQTGRDYVAGFAERLNTKQPDLFAPQPEAPVAEAEVPVEAAPENPFMGPAPAPIFAPQPQPENPATNTTLAEGLVDEEARAQEIQSMAPAKATDANSQMRQHLLETVLSDPDTKNPMARFRAELRKRGIDPTLVDDEGERIGKFEDAREAFQSGDQMVEPSAPDESGNFGIPERKPAAAPTPEFQATPQDGDFQQATLAEADPAPVQADDSSIRDRAMAHADKLGSSQRAWFLRGVDQAQGVSDISPPTKGNKPHARWFKQGQEFIAEEVAHREREAAKATPAVQEVKAKQTRGEQIKAKAKAAREAKTEPVADKPAVETSAKPSNHGPQTAAKSRDAFRAAVDKAVGSTLTAKQGQQLLSVADMEDNGTPTVPTLELWPMLDEALNEKPEPTPPKPTRSEQIKKKVKEKAEPAVKLRLADKDSGAPKAVQEAAARIEKQLRKRLDAMGLNDVNLDIGTLAELAIKMGTPTSGSYNPNKSKLITVAYDGTSHTATLDHEAIHALRDMGVFTEGEWALLVKAATDITGHMDWANKNYADLKLEQRQEEAVAEMYADWNASEEAKTPIGRIFQKLKAVLSAIKQVFKAEGRVTPDDVFKAVRSGTVGRRPRGLDLPRRMAEKKYQEIIDDAKVTSTVPQGRRITAGLPKEAQAPVQSALDNLSEFGKKAGLAFNFTRDVANMATKAGLPTAKRFIELHSEGHALAREFDERLADIKAQYEKLPANLRGNGPGTVNKFLYETRMKEAWGYAPKGLTVQVDPNMAKKFNALSPAAQAVIKASIQFNRDARRELLAASESAVNAEYDPMIAGAPDAKTKASYEAEKKLALKHFSRMHAARDDVPYSPLKRSGEYVVLGMSKEYAAAKDAGDTKAMDDLKSEADHYFVDFRDTAGEAKALAERVGTKFANVQHFNRDSVTDQIAGKELYVAFAQLRSKIASDLKDNPSDVATKQLYRLATDLYFHALADTSARKAELKSDMINAEDPVTGEAIDMMKAFVSRGQATSAFVAALHNSTQMQDAIEAMKAEAGTTAPGRDVRQRFYNELMWHYVENVTRKPNATVEKVKRFTSIFQLLFNPTYYLMNATQAAVFSLPMIAGRAGYAKGAAALTKAYADIMPLATAAGVTDRINFKGVPKDVVDVVDRLVKSGLIDSGMAQDLGNWDTRGDSALSVTWNKANRVLRQLPQSIENVNRLVTGIAAYRTERASGKTDQQAYDFASKTIYDTHGDYSGFNTPRVMAATGSLGQIAFQFRKFQFIMASLTAKMLHNSLKGETPEVRWAARKQLAFTLAHVTALAGTAGFPAASTIGWLTMTALTALDDDDDKKRFKDWDAQLEDKLKEIIGDETVADMMYKGAPYALLNTDLSGKLGMTNMLAVAPFADVDKATRSRDDFLLALANVVGGAAGGIAAKQVTSMNFFKDGDYYRGLENSLPNGLSGILKAKRMNDRGMQSNGGDTFLKPEDLTASDKALTAIGFPVRTLTDASTARSRQYEMTQHYNDMSKHIKARYNNAAKADDAAKQAAARKDWLDMQSAREKDGMKRQPLSALLRGPAQQRKREKNTMGGVQFNTATKKAVAEIVD